MRRHLDDHPSLNSSSGGLNSNSLSLSAAHSASSTPRLFPDIDARTGASSNIPLTTTTSVTLNSSFHSNRTLNAPIYPGSGSNSNKPLIPRQPLALIQETVHAVGTGGNSEMQSGVQFSLSSGFQARVAAATTLSQGGLGHSQSSSGVHHTLPGQAQAHSNTQIVHPLQQANSQLNKSFPGPLDCLSVMDLGCKVDQTAENSCAIAGKTKKTNKRRSSNKPQHKTVKKECRRSTEKKIQSEAKIQNSEESEEDSDEEESITSTSSILDPRHLKSGLKLLAYAAHDDIPISKDCSLMENITKKLAMYFADKCFKDIKNNTELSLDGMIKSFGEIFPPEFMDHLNGHSLTNLEWYNQGKLEFSLQPLKTLEVDELGLKSFIPYIQNFAKKVFLLTLQIDTSAEIEKNLKEITALVIEKVAQSLDYSFTGQPTITERNIISVIRNLFPREVSRCAVAHGLGSIVKFQHGLIVTEMKPTEKDPDYRNLIRRIQVQSNCTPAKGYTEYLNQYLKNIFVFLNEEFTKHLNKGTAESILPIGFYQKMISYVDTSGEDGSFIEHVIEQVAREIIEASLKVCIERRVRRNRFLKVTIEDLESGLQNEPFLQELIDYCCERE